MLAPASRQNTRYPEMWGRQIRILVKLVAARWYNIHSERLGVNVFSSSEEIQSISLQSICYIFDPWFGNQLFNIEGVTCFVFKFTNFM